MGKQLDDVTWCLLFDSELMCDVISAVRNERCRQDELHGAQRDLKLVLEGERYLDPENVQRARYEARKRDGKLAAADYILEELAEAFDAATPEEQYRELVEAAACCVKAAEALLWQMKGGE